MATRVLVVEDDPAARQLLVSILELEGHQVRAVSDGLEAVEVADSFQPHLALIDGTLPGLHGREVARRLAARAGTAIVLVTGADTADDELEGMRAGADAYVTKPYNPDVLVLKLRALLRRTAPTSAQDWQLGDLRVSERTAEVWRAGTPIQLRSKELEMLVVLLRHRGSIVSKRQLSAEVWGYDDEPTNVLEVTMSSLRRKLDVAGPQLIETVRGRGYKLRQPRE